MILRVQSAWPAAWRRFASLAGADAGWTTDARALAAAFALGIGALLTLPDLPSSWWLLPALAVALPRWPGRLLVLAFALGAAWAGWQAGQALEQRLPAARDGERATLTGHIEGLPEADAFRTRFQFVTETVPHRVRVSWYDQAPALAPGDCWRLTLGLSAPHGSLNPGSFDYEGWLWRKRIGATGYVREAEPCGAGGWTVDRWRQGLSQAINAALDGAPVAALIRALAVGDRGGLGEAQWRVLRRTGTSHLVAISGLHIGLIATLVFLALRWLAPRLPGGARVSALSVAAMGAAVAAVGYAALAGFALPTQRALVMTAVVLIAVVLRRRVAPSRLLALAAIAVLALDPFALLAPGFWLSFGAVAWILFLVGGRVEPPRWRFWLWLQPALVLGLMPLTLYWFGEASLAAPLANGLLIPAFGVVVPLVLAAVLATALAPALGAPLLSAVAWLLSVGWAGLEWLAGLPLTHFALPMPSLPALVAALAGIAVLLAPRGVPARWLGLAGLLPLLLPPATPAPGDFRLTVLDVGQGLAAVVRTSDHALLFDAGPRFRTGFDAGAALVLPYLRAAGITRLDTAIVSHGDIDHRGGWPAVREGIVVGRVLGAAGRPCRAGQGWRWDGVRFEILHPPPGAWSDNDASCVLRVTGPGGTALLTGDIERDAEQQLIARAADLAADVVVVPHHGSDSSSTPAFVRRVAPRYAVVAAGWNNRWGFPDPVVAARYRQAGACLLQTGRLGAIRIAVAADGGVGRPRATRLTRRRIWHLPRPPAGCAGPRPLSFGRGAGGDGPIHVEACCRRRLGNGADPAVLGPGPGDRDRARLGAAAVGGDTVASARPGR